MAPQNRAIWLKEKQAPVMVVDDAPYSPPGPNEVVINTKAVAINPVDHGIQKLGILCEEYPAILGCDLAGIIEEVGSNVPFKPGDRVIGQASCVKGYKCSAFQEYVVVPMPLIAKIPDDVAFSDGAVLPLAISTAAAALFQSKTLGLVMPPKQAKGTLLVWGASSSVGSCGVQLAVAAGYEVIGIASQRNHEFVKSIGARECFDQTSSTIVEDVLAAVKGKDVVGAYDAISTDATLPKLCQILSRAGGRKFIGGVMPGIESMSTDGVEIATCFSWDIEQNDVGPHIWQSFLPQALAAKSFQYKPDADIIGNRLEGIQKACDIIGNGVSAKKLVVTL